MNGNSISKATLRLLRQYFEYLRSLPEIRYTISATAIFKCLLALKTRKGEYTNET